jgi:hypothetical protein
MRTPVVVVCPNHSTFRVSHAEADRLVRKSLATREDKKRILLKRDKSSDELIGRLRIRKSGRYGPVVVQVE